jgi:hypothetical protein
MEKIKAHWKKIATGLGVGFLGLLSYYFYRRYKSRALISPDQPLTRDEAMARSKIFKKLDYTLFLQLWDPKKKSHIYEGSVLITFDASIKEDTFIDYKGQVLNILLNGVPLEVSKHHIGNRIFLPKQHLHKNSSLLIQFESHYSSTVHGLRKFINQDDVSKILI